MGNARPYYRSVIIFQPLRSQVLIDCHQMSDVEPERVVRAYTHPPAFTLCHRHGGPKQAKRVRPPFPGARKIHGAEKTHCWGDLGKGTRGMCHARESAMRVGDGCAQGAGRCPQSQREQVGQIFVNKNSLISPPSARALWAPNFRAECPREDAMRYSAHGDVNFCGYKSVLA